MARARQTTSPKVWLITGSSAGLGLQLARAVRSRGDRVIATARRPESLAALQGDPDSATLQLDVTSSQEVLNAKVKEALALFGQIDVLVNNAGYILSGVWEQLRYGVQATQAFNADLLFKTADFVQLRERSATA